MTRNNIVPSSPDAGITTTPRLSAPLTASQRIEEAQTLLSSIGPSVKEQYMVQIQGRNYLQVAGAASLGFALGYTSRIVHCDRALTGDGLPHWTATAEVIDTATGEIVGRGTGHVFDDERPWGGRPQFARAAMCQTRAQGRALKGVVGWLFGMLGAESSLTEEMPSDAYHPQQQRQQPLPAPPPQPAVAPQPPAQPVQQWGASQPQAAAQPAANELEIVPAFLDEYKMKNAEATPFWRLKTQDDAVYMVWDRQIRDVLAASVKRAVVVQTQPPRKEGQNPSIIGVAGQDDHSIAGTAGAVVDDGIPF